MRIHLRIKTSEKPVPIFHQPLLAGTINKWLGNDNKEHGKISLFSFSQLSDGKIKDNNLIFQDWTSLFISSYKTDCLKRIIFNIKNDPSLFNDLTVNEIIIEDTPDLSNRDFFLAASPILIKRKIENKTVHIPYNHLKAGDYLKETLLTKLKIAGIEDENFQIQFDNTYQNAKLKLIDYNGIGNKANWCPIIIKGSNKIKSFAWNVGLGNSTGIGFGAIK